MYCNVQGQWSVRPLLSFPPTLHYESKPASQTHPGQLEIEVSMSYSYSMQYLQPQGFANVFMMFNQKQSNSLCYLRNLWTLGDQWVLSIPCLSLWFLFNNPHLLWEPLLSIYGTPSLFKVLFKKRISTRLFHNSLLLVRTLVASRLPLLCWLNISQFSQGSWKSPILCLHTQQAIYLRLVEQSLTRVMCFSLPPVLSTSNLPFLPMVCFG